MPYVQPNILLTPTEKLIKPYECSWIVIEGPNMKGKVNLDGLEIKYDSFYLSQLTLNETSSDQPLLYGFLGESVTFLMVRARYMPLDPNWAVETEQYIEYYFEDEPGTIRYMGQMLMLSGNSVKRIPQIYFNNPSSKYKVYLEILMANLPQSSITNPTQFTKMGTFSGMYWNSIISDVINYSTPTSTGSTELKILDITGSTILVIPYNNIRTITKYGSTDLIIGLDTEEKVRLSFLSEFNCDQANSRINWVLKSSRTRILTKTEPVIDTTPPDITWNDVLTGATTGITSGITTLYLLPTGQTYTSSSLRTIFISGVTDNRDGSISSDEVGIEIYIYNDILPVTGITYVGVYRVIFTVKDLANNWLTEERYISIYDDNIGIFESGYWNDDGIWIDIDIWVD